MIVEKHWERYNFEKISKGGTVASYHDVYRGWFLFGIVPLYVMRDRTRIR